MFKPNPTVVRILSIIILLFSLTAGFVKAVTPAVQITQLPDWVIPVVHKYQTSSLKSANNGFIYALWNEQIHVEKKATFNNIIREVITESGVQNGSNISVNFDPTYEKLEFHKIIIWRNNKPLNRLSKSAFKIVANEEELSRFLYHGSYSAFLILEDIRKGDQIEYSYTITGNNPIFGNMFSREIYFQGIAPIAHIYASLIVSAGRNLNFKSFNNVPKTKISDKDGIKKYEWESYNVPAAILEEYQPSWINSFATAQVSEYTSWAEVVNWAAKVNPIASKLGGNLGERIKELLSSAKINKEKFFREAVRIVQDEVRYMGVETGVYSHRANHPEKVYNQRYGDCKDKSLLLASMLNMGGIKAHLALVNTRAGNEINNYLPSPAAFNHVVVVAILNGVEVWVDPTMSNQGGTAGEIAFPHYKKALVIKNGNAKLSDLEIGSIGNITCHERYLIANEKDKVKLNVESRYSADQADIVRAQLSSLSYQEVCKSNLDYYSKIYPEIEIKDSLKINDDRDKNEITITGSYFITDFFQKDSTNGRYHAGFYANYINDQLPSITSKRRYPIFVNYPYDLDYTIQIELADGWNIPKESTSISRNGYYFGRHVFVVGNVLNINYQFWYLKDHVDAGDAAEFSKDIKQLQSSALSYTISYQPIANSDSFITNYWFIALSVAFIFVLAYIAMKVYRDETKASEIYLAGYGRPIGGWLYLVIIGLFFTPLRVLFFLFDKHYFSLELWNFYPPYGTQTLFRGIIIFELLFNLLIIVCSIFCLYLLFKRRDILPKVVIFYFLANIAGILIDLIISREVVANDSKTELIRSVIVAIIWVPYFLRSSRVKETFIVPYPDDQICYDEAEEAQIQVLEDE